MPDWTKSMYQTFEFYSVNPENWENKAMLNDVTSASITRDLNSETLGSATFSSTTFTGEEYIRAYLVTVQNGITEHFPLGTYLVQSPTFTFNGMYSEISSDAYSPLIELREKHPSIGYTLRKGQDIMKAVIDLASLYMRAPVISSMRDNTDKNFERELSDHYTAAADDTWFSYIYKLIGKAGYSFALDELGKLSFTPIEKIDGMNPIWTYDDGNSSILYKDVSIDKDIYGIPNVVHVYKQTADGVLEAIAENHLESSPVSIEARGRTIEHIITNPNISSANMQHSLEEYAEEQLKSISTVQYVVDYKHAYCPVTIGDCVRLDYKAGGLDGVKARVISQTIDCKPGCMVTEKAVYTEKLYEVNNGTR